MKGLGTDLVSLNPRNTRRDGVMHDSPGRCVKRYGAYGFRGFPKKGYLIGVRILRESYYWGVYVRVPYFRKPILGSRVEGLEGLGSLGLNRGYGSRLLYVTVGEKSPILSPTKRTGLTSGHDTILGRTLGYCPYSVLEGHL